MSGPSTSRRSFAVTAAEHRTGLPGGEPPDECVRSEVNGGEAGSGVDEPRSGAVHVAGEDDPLTRHG
jgi:hypothetical protein